MVAGAGVVVADGARAWVPAFAGTTTDAGAAMLDAFTGAVLAGAGPITGRSGALRSSSTSRPRSSCAAGATSPTRNARLSSGRSAEIVPTGKPAGNRLPRPEVTTTSPTFTSLDKGMLAQREAIAAPGAVRDQAHAVAHHRDGHGVVGIGEQQGGGMHRGGGDHLPDDAAGIDHDLADAHAVAAAGIEHETLARGIQVDVEDRGELHVQAAALHDAEHAAQAIVVGRRRSAGAPCARCR